MISKYKVWVQRKRLYLWGVIIHQRKPYRTWQRSPFRFHEGDHVLHQGRDQEQPGSLFRGQHMKMI